MDTALVVTASESYMEIKKLLSINDVVSDAAGSLREARIALCDAPYTLLVVDNNLPDGSAREFAIESSRRSGLDIILLVNPVVSERIAAGMEKYGVYVLAKPLKENEFSVLLRNMRTGRRKLETLDQKCRRLLKRLDEEKILTKAKCLLALHEGMEEEEAHRYLEKKAMDGRVTLLDAADVVLKKYSR